MLEIHELFINDFREWRQSDSVLREASHNLTVNFTSSYEEVTLNDIVYMKSFIYRSFPNNFLLIFAQNK